MSAPEVTPQQLHDEVKTITSMAAALPTPAALATDARQGYFVTGATGFLGGWVVNYLATVAKTTAPVYLMCRKPLPAVQEIFAKKGLAMPAGVRVVQGDNSKPTFGLDAETIAAIHADVKYYVHCAAHVVFGCTYADARPGTVGGADALVRLVLGAPRGAEVHYISTNGVYPPGFSAANGGKPCHESQQDFDLYAQTLQEGYGWSKWIAERAVTESCAAAGVPCRAYRPGNIGWAKDGRVNPIDFQTLIVFACRAIAARPAVSGWRFELTPVDELAAFVAGKCGSNATAIHNVIGQRIAMEDYLAASDLKAVPMPEWIELAKAALEGGKLSERDQGAVKETLASFEEYVTLDMYLSDTNDYFTENSHSFKPTKEYMTII